MIVSGAVDLLGTRHRITTRDASGVKVERAAIVRPRCDRGENYRKGAGTQEAGPEGGVSDQDSRVGAGQCPAATLLRNFLVASPPARSLMLLSERRRPTRAVLDRDLLVSGEDVSYHMAVDVGKPEASALELVGQLFVVES